MILIITFKKLNTKGELYRSNIATRKNNQKIYDYNAWEFKRGIKYREQ